MNSIFTFGPRASIVTIVLSDPYFLLNLLPLHLTLIPTMIMNLDHVLFLL
jgi:hypothetical protein